MNKLEKLDEGVYLLAGASNVGLLVQDGAALVVDAGLDKSAAKQIVRALEVVGARLAGVVITHAHADHSGGAAELVKRTGAPLYATALEAVVVENPLFEPLYLYGGASPIRELTHKFTLATPCTVDHRLETGEVQIDGFDIEVLALPGHAPGQIGLVWRNVFFAADTYLPAETIARHGIPFCVDLDQALESLDRMAASRARWYLAGHGRRSPRLTT